MSARELDKPGFAGRCTAILSAAGVPANNICLEVTETALADNGHDIYGQLAALRRLGVQVSLDDFGVGYSSLARLQHLPIDVIKIDQCFVANVADSASDRALVSAVIELAHQLGCTAVAEGVETPAQRDVLRKLRCDYLQGYLIGYPAALEAAAQRLTADRPVPAHPGT
jgi:EAL domain-containing protein (putative c-di-GMP-specific phosphodiesterase class I)